MQAAAATAASGQTPTTGSVGVQAVDGGAGDAALLEVQIELVPVAGGLARHGSTGRSGVYIADLLIPGTYDILVERLGYQPVRLTGVPVVAGRRLLLRVSLEAAEGAVEAPRVVPYRPPLAAVSRPGAGRLFRRREVETVPQRGASASDVLLLTSLGERGITTEGLPGRLAALMVDGVIHSAARHPAIAETELGALVYPLLAPVRLELVTGHTDLQSQSVAGALLSGVTAPGPERLGGGVQGAWESGAMEEHATGGAGYRGSFDIGGPLLGDSARIRLFGTGISTEKPFERWSEGRGEAGAARLLEAVGEMPADVSRHFAARATTLNVGGRFDWQLGEVQAVELTAAYSVGTWEQAPRTQLPGHAPAEVGTSDLHTSIATTVGLADRWRLEVRAGAGQSLREYGLPAPGVADAGPHVSLVEVPVSIGVDPGHEGRFERSDLAVQAAVHAQADSYRFQAGLGGSFSGHDLRYGFGRSGAYLFGDETDLEARAGTFFRLDAAEPSASFSTQRFHAFMQNTWRLAAGLDVRTGARYDAEILPAGDILRASDWLALTGVDNAAAPERLGTIGLVVGFDWDVQQRQEWLLRGDITVRGGELPPELFAEALSFDGRQSVLRAAGVLDGLEGTENAVAFRRLTILAPDLQAPITTRGSLGVARVLGARTTLLMAAALRRTENLPLRSDLNLVAQPLGLDQDGRPVFGVPLLAGGLIVPEPGTSRRFSDYDVVSAISSRGTSDYYGITLGLERRGGSGDVAASYTFSATRDNWVGAAAAHPGPDLSPLPGGGMAEDWGYGISDFDVPHRLAVWLDAPVPGLPAARLGGLFRRESGRPFTPGYPPGTDLAGLGSGGNDPAFIDDGLEGMDVLLQEWDCLREHTGRFIARNACRAPARTALDLRLQTGILGGPRFGAEIVVEALNVLHTGHGWIDTALLLVDREAEADLDIADGAVAFPFRVNPAFGREILAGPDAFQLRAGLQLRF